MTRRAGVAWSPDRAELIGICLLCRKPFDVPMADPICAKHGELPDGLIAVKAKCPWCYKWLDGDYLETHLRSCKRAAPIPLDAT